jgi:ABC-2 type transport system ATP-binding protein
LVNIISFASIRCLSYNGYQLSKGGVVAVIKTVGLTKYYGKTRGIEDLNLEVDSGEIFGFLGPNGAGKTTTIRLLLSLIRPTRGFAHIFGIDIRQSSLEIRQRLGYVPGDVVLYDGMTGMNYLRLMGSFRRNHDGQRLLELQERLDLDLSRKARTYSKGMKQKLAIIQAFMSDPELLILDEPTLGLDPLIQRQFYDLMLEEKNHGKTIFLSSHILSEVERVCDRVGIVREGHLVDVERVDTLKHKKVRRMELILSRELTEDEIKLEGVDTISVSGKRVELIVHGDVPKLLEQLCQLPVEDMAFPEASLEDSFMEFYGEEQT